MRIVAGIAKGRPLRAPAGDRTRPTSDRVREALFSMLEARLEDGLQGLLVLDLYAGSGALALEAISRGASGAVLVDSSRQAQEAIIANAAALGFADLCELRRSRVEVALRQLAAEQRRFQVVVADPPYVEDADQLLDQVLGSGVLAAGGILALEHSRRQPPREGAPGLELLVRRRHGDTEISLYRCPTR